MSKQRRLIYDRAVQIEGSQSLTPNGYLPISARIARTGVQDYYAFEFWPLFEDREPDSIIRLWRPPEEVFDAASMASFERLPVTDDHPWEDVAASNWSEYARGMTEGAPSRDGDFLRHNLLITDADLISDVQIGLKGERTGKCEVSCGWTFMIDLTAGTTPEGEPYDMIAREIRGNHVAIVDIARCGPACRLGDSAKSPAARFKLKDMCNCKTPASPEDETMTIKTRSVVVDGITIEATEQSAQVIDKLTAERDDARSKLATVQAEAATAKDAHDKAIADKDAEIQKLKDEAPTAATLEKMAADRAGLIDTAKKMLGDSFDFTGKSADEIRKAAVEKKLGDSAKDYDAAQITIAFDTLARTAADTSKPGDKPAPGAKDAFAPQAGPGTSTHVTDLDKSRTERAQRKADKWKRPA
jgi:hypothetical protein